MTFRQWLREWLGIETDRLVQQAYNRTLEGVLEGHDRRIKTLEERPDGHLDRALAIAQSLAEATLRPVQVAAAMTEVPRGPSVTHELPEEVLDAITDYAQPGTGLYGELVAHAFQSLRRHNGDAQRVIAEIRRGGTAYDDAVESWTPRPVVADDDPELAAEVAAAVADDPMTPETD